MPAESLAPFALEAPDNFNLEQTLMCGQAFRWKQAPDGTFTGVVENKVCSIRREEKHLLVFGDDSPGAKEFWRSYFDLDADYAAWRNEISKTPSLKPAVQWSSGIRLLRQQPWEALISFIISQNNHLSRITGIIDRLCSLYGTPLKDGHHAFVTPKQLADLCEDEIASLRCGYRAAWIADAAQRVQSGEIDLQRVQTMPLHEAKEMLMRIRGVGPKVADCVLLYGMHRLECCPVDVWVKRGLKSLLPNGMPPTLLPFAGVAQQYIFHYMRTCPDAPCPKGKNQTEKVIQSERRAKKNQTKKIG